MSFSYSLKLGAQTVRHIIHRKMKDYLIIFLLLTTNFIFAQEKSTQPQFREFRNNEEIENEEWHCKITDEIESGNYILQLVSSKEKSDYDNQWLCVQVLDKTTRLLVQEMELEYGGRGDSFDIDDYNFDGYEDFSLYGGCGTLDNFYSFYFLFDPETKTFFESDFSGTNMFFCSSTKTITSSNRCCGGSAKKEDMYKLIDNRMVLIEQQCLRTVMDEETGDVLFDEEGYLIFEEVDCNTPYLNIYLQSVGLKKNFQLRLAIYDEDMAGGFVLYKGKMERIPIHFDHFEDIEEDESYPDDSHAKLFYYNEMYEDENTGTYSFVLRNADIYDVYYTHKKDGKVFALKTIADYDNTNE